MERLLGELGDHLCEIFSLFEFPTCDRLTDASISYATQF